MSARQTSSKSHDAFQVALSVPNASPRFPVVGIGASAGGLEAITACYKELAPDLGVAYVLVFHLSSRPGEQSQ